KQIGLALQNYHAAYNHFPNNGYQPGVPPGVWPPAWKPGEPAATTIVVTTEGAGWGGAWPWGYGTPTQNDRFPTGSYAYSILPFIDQDATFQAQGYNVAVKSYSHPSRRPATPLAVPATDPVYPGWFYTTPQPPGGAAYVNLWGRTDYAANDQV